MACLEQAGVRGFKLQKQAFCVQGKGTYVLTSLVFKKGVLILEFIKRQFYCYKGVPNQKRRFNDFLYIVLDLGVWDCM